MTHRPSSPWRWGGNGTVQYAACLLVAMLALLPVVSFADSKQQDVAVHIGSHDGYGRVVFYLPPGTDYHLTQQGQRVVLQFAGDLTVGAPRGVPRNVVSITGGADQAELVLAPGTGLHSWRLGDLVVIDVRDRDTAVDCPAQQGTGATKSPTAKPAATAKSAPTPPATAPVAAPPPAQSSSPKTEPTPLAQPKVVTATQQPEPATAAAVPPQSNPQEPPPASTPQPSPLATAASAGAQSTPSVDSELVVPTDGVIGVSPR